MNFLKTTFRLLLIVGVLYFIPTTTFSQETNIDSTSIHAKTPWDFSKSFPPRATFANFWDLKYNRPRETDFQIKFNTKVKPENRTYVLYNKEGRKKLKKVYAFSSGKALYIKHYGNFAKAVSIGTRYIFYKAQINRNQVPSVAIVGSVRGRKRMMGFVLDLQLGQIKELTKKNMRYILQDFPELLENYNLHRKGKSLFDHSFAQEKYLIDIINQRYASGILIDEKKVKEEN